MANSVIKAGIQIKANVDGHDEINRLAQTIADTSDETNELSQQAQKLAQEWQKAQANTALITHYKAIKSSLADNRQEIAQTEQNLRQLDVQMKNGATKLQEKQYQLQQQLVQLNQQKRELLNHLRETNTQMNQAGISTKNLAEKQKQLSEQADKAEKELKQLNQEAKKLQQIAQSKAVLGLDIDDRAHQEINRLNQAYNNLKQSGGLTKAELARATQAYQMRLQELNHTLDQSKQKMTPIAQSIGKIGLAAAGTVGGLMGLKQGLNDVLNATQEYQAITTRFAYAFSGMDEGVKQLEFVRQETSRLGLEFMGSANGYAQLAAATKELNITTEQTQSIFKGVASAVATMGLSADDANGVFLALSQIAGKGKVSMEELRGQLGERLAPAMSIAAQAMGVTTAELEKLVESGLAAETFLPRFGVALEQAFGADAATNVESLSGQINLLKNSYNEFLIKLGEGGVGQATIVVLKDIGAALESAQAKFDEFMKSEDGLLLQQSLSQFWDLLKQIGSTIIEVFQIAQDNFRDFTGSLHESSREISLIQTLLMGVNLTVAGLHDGFKTVGIVFNLFSGAAKSLMAQALNFASKFTFGNIKKELKQMARELREESDKNYQAAQQSALNFESQISKTITQMAKNAEQVRHVYDEANHAAQSAIDQTAKAEEQARELSQTYKNAQTAISSFGLDMRAAMNEPTPAMIEMQDNLAKLVTGFDDLSEKGVDVSDLLGQAIVKMTESAKNQADIILLKQEIQNLGEAGKFSMQEVEHAILAADQKLNQLKQSTDPTAQAFEKLGMKTRETMRLSAEETRLAFEAVEKSGEAVSGNLKEKFVQVAQDLLATGDANQLAWVRSKAAAYDYTVIVDNSGKLALQAAAQTAQAAQTQVAAHNQVAQAAQQSAAVQADAAKQATAEMEKVGQTAEKNSKKLSELGQKVRYAMAQTGDLAKVGTAAWDNTLRHYQNLIINVTQSTKRLNEETENGGNIAHHLAQAEALAASNAKKLDKTTLSNLTAAIDKARAKMKAMADEAAETKKQLEKQLLNAQGNEDAVAAMEQQEALAKLQKQYDAAKAMGNKNAMADLQKSMDLQRQIYQTELDNARKQAEEERLAAEQAAREQRKSVQTAMQSAPKVDVAIDENELRQIFAANNQQIADSAVGQIMGSLKDAMMRQR